MIRVVFRGQFTFKFAAAMQAAQGCPADSLRGDTRVARLPPDRQARNRPELAD